MAVSKIWPLYQTIGKAVNYICNYEKTEDGTLIFTHGCSEKFADYEFKDIATKARKVSNARIGYHMMISFSPEDELTPEKAMEIGKEIVDKYTHGKHQYVLSVHTDQKHLHVHCIINSVSSAEHKKLHIQDKDLSKLEKLTDKACIENGLSVIEKKSGVKGRSKYEYDKHIAGESWKDKLRECIDKNIFLADSFDDFIDRMQMEEGYEIKIGKYLSFRAEGQERFTRTKRLGDFYSIDSIKDRINNKEKYLDAETKIQNEEKVIQQNNHTEKKQFIKSDFTLISSKDNHVKKLINVESNLKAKQHSAYRKKLNMINIDTYAGMMKFVSKYHLIYKEDFEKVKSELEGNNNFLTSEIRKAYSEMNELEADVKQFQKFFKNKELYREYVMTSDKDKKYELNEANKQYQSAMIYFKRNEIPLEKVTLKNLKQKITRMEELNQKILTLKKERTDVRNDIKKLEIIRQNNSQIFGGELSGSSLQDDKNRDKENMR